MRGNKRKILGSLAVGALTGIFFGPAAGVFFGGLAYGLSNAVEKEVCAVPKRNFVPGIAGGYRLNHSETKALVQANQTRESISQVNSRKEANVYASAKPVQASVRLSPPSRDEETTNPKTLDEVIRRLIQA